MSVFVKALLVVMLLQSASCLPRDVNSLQKGEDKRRESINEQRKELRSLLCEPKPAVVKIADYLEYHDALKDKTYFPKVAVVNRCLENCTFCGNSHLGVSVGSCQPDEKAITTRSIIARYYEEGKEIFQEVLVPEHTACKCPK